MVETGDRQASASETEPIHRKEEKLTNLPLANRQVKGIDAPEYKLNDRCPVVGCSELGTERHHLWRRSFLIGDYWWVRLPNGEISGNCVYLCNTHHRKVTINECSIRMLDGVFHWCPLEGNTVRLAWQPPIYSPEEFQMYHSVGIRPLHTPVHDHEAGECPTCHQRIKPPKPVTPPEERKPRRTWSIAVPKDKQEDGADVLDTLIDEARKALDANGVRYSEEHKYKYHILAISLALFVQNAQLVMADG